MKKFFTLLALAVLGVTSSVWAADYVVTATRTITNENKTSTWGSISANGGNAIQNGQTALGEGMYFVATGKCTMGGKQINVKSGALMYLEVPSATAAGSVEIITGNANDRYFETPSGAKLYMKGSNKINFTSADIEEVDGVNYLKLTSMSDNKFNGVEIVLTSGTYVVLTKLATPEISFNAATGEVTIGTVANASKVTYTIDGSVPSSESTEYTNPFVVEDGTTINAVAIGDGTYYSNSNVSTKQVILTGITVADPVVNQSYGTVAISCASPNATIEYSVDGGANWNTYSRAFTLTTNTDLKARASRTGCTSSAIIDETITAVPANAKTKTIVMGFGAFEGSGKVLTGRSDDVANGYTLTLLTEQDKSWIGKNKITISSISAERTTICGSNGVQCRLDLPDGVKATKLTLYSYVNGAKSATNSAWKEVNGENLNSVINDVPMGAFNDVADYQANPDVRIFPLDNVEGSITFTNGGIQTCFVMELDIIEPSISVSVSEAGYATLYSSVALTIPEGVTAYTGEVDENKLKLTAVETTIPALTAVVLEAEEGSYTFATTTSEDFEGENDLKGVLADTPVDANSVLVLGYENSEVGFYTFSGTTLAAGKAYLEMPASGAPAIYFSFEEETEVTGVYNLRVEEKANAAFDLSGRRANGKGLMIQNGKVVLVK